MAVRDAKRKKKRQKGEKVQALEVPVSYETRPEVTLGSPIGPLAEIRRQAVMDATASHMFVSANALPGQILVHIRSGLHANLGTLTDAQSQIPDVLDRAAFHR